MANAYAKNKSGFINLKYEKNAAVHLVLGLFTTYIIIQSLYIIILVTSDTQHNIFNGVIVPNIAIQPYADFVYRPWTILTYAMTHDDFYQMIINLFWLYLFGNVIQSQIGYRNVIPLYVIAVLLSGLIYIGLTYFTIRFAGSYYILGFFGGLSAFATAALVINPTYKIQFTRSVNMPSWLVVIVYIILLGVLFIPKYDVSMFVLCGAGALVGGLYALCVKSGFDIGRKFYNIWDKTHEVFMPEEEILEEASKNNIDEATINAIQEKIEKEGINYLSTKEIDILNRWRNK